MPDWDENSRELQTNISAALDMARQSATSFQEPTLELPRTWQSRIMQGLTPGTGAHTSWYGKYRGEEGQEYIGVSIGLSEGTPPELVEQELDHFIQRVRKIVAEFDEKILITDKSGNLVVRELDDNAIRAIIGFMALVHGEWIRIHPFANGNGRSARLWANWVAMRYGLTPFVSLRPRPEYRYEWAAFMAMQGNWQAMRPVFEEMFDEMASEAESKS